MSRNRGACADKAVFSGEIELTRGFDLPSHPRTSHGQRFDEARLLVRVDGEPVGFATVPLGEKPLTEAAVGAAIERELGAALRGRASRDRLVTEAGTARGGTVTVIVCTRDRPETLSGCLAALRRAAFDGLEVVVVDNASSDDRTRNAVDALAREDGRFRYVHEPRPGLSRARNRGLAHASGEFVAYTDDDVRVDRQWVAGLLRGFARRDDVGCVTGLVASASLEGAAERYFDARVWWSTSCEPRVYEGRGPSARSGLHPYAAGGFGTGANFAFRTALLRELGGFDERLGAGSPCAGGEDLDIFVRVLRAGLAIAYEPAALVWHEHRSDLDDLRRQMYAYGKGLSAVLCKYASSRHTALDLLRRTPAGVRHLLLLGLRAMRAGQQAGHPKGLLLTEARGWVAGPLAYLRARRRQDPDNLRAVAP